MTVGSRIAARKWTNPKNSAIGKWPKAELPVQGAVQAQKNSAIAGKKDAPEGHFSPEIGPQGAFVGKTRPSEDAPRPNTPYNGQFKAKKTRPSVQHVADSPRKLNDVSRASPAGRIDPPRTGGFCRSQHRSRNPVSSAYGCESWALGRPAPLALRQQAQGDF